VWFSVTVINNKWVFKLLTISFVILDHTKSVECVAFSSDSRLLCSGSWDKSAVLWNTEVLTILQQTERLHSIGCHKANNLSASGGFPLTKGSTHAPRLEFWPLSSVATAVNNSCCLPYSRYLANSLSFSTERDYITYKGNLCPAYTRCTNQALQTSSI